MADAEIEFAMAEKEQLENGDFGTGSGNERGQDENDGNSEIRNQDARYEDEYDADLGIGTPDEWIEDEDDELDLCPELDWSLERAAERGEEFWLGGKPIADADGESEWNFEEAGMRRLAGTDDISVEMKVENFIDPLLRHV